MDATVAHDWKDRLIQCLKTIKCSDVILDSTKEWNHEHDHEEHVAVEEPTTEACLSRNKAAIIRDTLIYMQATLHSS